MPNDRVSLNLAAMPSTLVRKNDNGWQRSTTDDETLAQSTGETEDDKQDDDDEWT